MLWNVKQVLWFQNAISSLDCKYLYGKDDEDSIVHELCLLYNYLKRKSSIQAELPKVFGYTYITQTNSGENEVMCRLLFRLPSPLCDPKGEAWYLRLFVNFYRTYFWKPVYMSYKVILVPVFIPCHKRNRQWKTSGTCCQCLILIQ